MSEVAADQVAYEIIAQVNAQIAIKAHSTEYDTLFALPAFEELLRLSIDTCLSGPEPFEKYLGDLNEQSAEAELTLFQQLGCWGVRIASDYQRLSNEYEPSTLEPNSSITETLKQPLMLGDKPLPQVEAKIEAFGKAVLDEAFLCLGPDAELQVAAYLKASTVTKKIAVLKWLHQRVRNIVNKVPAPTQGSHSSEEGALNSDEGEFYHPIRLSPKVIGSWPDIQVATTCLGASILVSSFLEKLGIKYLHCGVMETETNLIENRYMFSYEKFRELCGDLELPVNETLDDFLQAAFVVAVGNTLIDRGFHAANIVQISKSVWVNIDPNYDLFSRLKEQSSSEINTIYEELEAISGQPGARGYQLDIDRLVRMLPSSLIVNKNLLIEDIESLLDECITTDQPDGASKQLVKQIFNTFVACINEHNNLAVSFVNFCNNSNCRQEDYLLQLTRNVIEASFGLPKGGDIDSVLARCIGDLHFRQRRLEDLRIATLAGLLILYVDMSKVSRKDHLVMSTLEAGMPAYRIGAAILSDFDQCGSSALPPSFWQTYWPSYTVATEHAANAEDRLGQIIKSKLLLETSRAKFLKYTNKRVTVLKLLEQLQEVSSITPST